MRSLSRLIATALCLASAGFLAGCADYLKRRDAISDSAGDALDWNKAVQTIDPWPPHAMNTGIPGDGRRVSRVVGRYISGAPVPSSGASASPLAPSADAPASSGSPTDPAASSR